MENAAKGGGIAGECGKLRWRMRVAAMENRKLVRTSAKTLQTGRRNHCVLPVSFPIFYAMALKLPNFAAKKGRTNSPFGDVMAACLYHMKAGSHIRSLNLQRKSAKSGLGFIDKSRKVE